MKKKLSSFRAKMFFMLCVVVLVVVTLLFVANNTILEPYYIYRKRNNLISVYQKIDDYYNNNLDEEALELELEKIALNNNFEINIFTKDNSNIYITSRDVRFAQVINSQTIYSRDGVIITKIQDKKTGLDLMSLTGRLDNGYNLSIRMSVASIRQSIDIVNNFLYIIGGIIVSMGGILILIVSKKVADPVKQLNSIAKKMSDLDFSQKYLVEDTGDEIDELRKKY